jgi:hypothetical protein
MSVLSSRLIRYVRFPLALSAMGLVAVLGFQGLQAAWLTLVLLLLEISLSFDNAIVNARVLDRMTPGQQQFFLTWGLVIPVFGVRFLGPLVMVALAGQVGLGEALDAALHHPDHYRELLEIAEHYFFDEAKTLHWWTALEKRLSAAGRIEALEVAVALIVLLVLVAIAPGEMRGDLMVCGVLGVVLQLLATSLADAFGDEAEAGARVAAGGGLASFLYLELLDASFSLDGTIGAFAITSNIILILVGLGLGALFIRSLTLMLARERALEELIYLEHGAHYAIGALGLLMLAGIPLAVHHLHLPEWLSGLIGIVLLAIALVDSIRQGKRSA